MMAVGLWASQLGRPALWLLPLTFPVVMIAGALMGWSGVALPWIEAGIVATVIALGAVIALRCGRRWWWRGVDRLVRAVSRLRARREIAGARHAACSMARVSCWPRWCCTRSGLASACSTRYPPALAHAGGAIAAVGVLLLAI